MVSNTLAVGERPNFNLRSWLKGAYFTGSPTTNVCVFSAKNISHPIADSEDEAIWTSLGVRFNDLFFGSQHPGGALFVFCDSSVHFFQSSIDYQTLERLADRAGGEPTGWIP